MENYKTCSKCSQTLALICFVKDKYKKSGYSSQCKNCRSYRRKQSLQDPIYKQKVLESARKSFHKNKEKRHDYYRLWASNNKDKRQAINTRYAEKNRTKNALRMREYRKKNPEMRKNWSKQNPAKQAELYVIRRLRKNTSKYLILDKEIRLIYEKNCFYCGSDKDIQIDHIFPLARGGEHRIGNLLSACKSCNSSKKDNFIMEWKIGKRKSKRFD
jgi:5-methylcytosine-specific restriction endonuclease McrA